MTSSFRALTPFGRTLFSTPHIHVRAIGTKSISTQQLPNKMSELFDQAMTSDLRQSTGVLHRYYLVLEKRLNDPDITEEQKKLIVTRLHTINNIIQP